MSNKIELPLITEDLTKFERKCLKDISEKGYFIMVCPMHASWKDGKQIYIGGHSFSAENEKAYRGSMTYFKDRFRESYNKIDEDVFSTPLVRESASRAWNPYTALEKNAVEQPAPITINNIRDNIKMLKDISKIMQTTMSESEKFLHDST